ncbi:hypothetical protein QCA50_011147 [Cerrena zonata]|uniref:Uncharacterized protein n=1 Tax=Cerrena zonata TaxID=2478898 RepID=A0AAW0G826_9APHY
MYKGLEGFIDLHEPVVEVLQGTNFKSPSTELEKELPSLLHTLNRHPKFARQSRRLTLGLMKCSAVWLYYEKT